MQGLRSRFVGAFLVAFGAGDAGVAHAQQRESDFAVQNAGPGEAEYDSEVAFGVTVTNLGPRSSPFELSNPTPAGMTFVDAFYNGGEDVMCVKPDAGTSGTLLCNAGNLLHGSSMTFTVVFKIDGFAPAGTTFTSIATVSTTALDPNAANNSASAVVQIPQPAVADVTLETGPGFGTTPGGPLDLFFYVVNKGPGLAKHIEITGGLPANVTWIGPFGYDPTRPRSNFCDAPVGNAIACHMWELPDGERWPFRLHGILPAIVLDGTTYEATLSVASDNDPNASNNALTVSQCVQADNCSAGACNAGVAVVCTEDCRATCNPANGMCESPDGLACDDGDPCTLDNHCRGGACIGGTPKCPAAGACHEQGACDPDTGECAPNTVVADGTACTGTNACKDYACVAGKCHGERKNSWCGQEFEPANPADAGDTNGPVPDASTSSAADAGNKPTGTGGTAMSSGTSNDAGSTGSNSAGSGSSSSGHDDTTQSGSVVNGDSDGGIAPFPHVSACGCRIAGATAHGRTAWIALVLFGTAAVRLRRKQRAT
jgi:hypothetical protein